MSAGAETFTFQAEIRQLLHVLAHSLYQSKDIAIRELISNASDALDKMRHIALTNPDYRDAGPFEIEIENDPDNRRLTIRDNGIGMTHDELVRNLGTIAHSGSLQFLKNAPADSVKDLSLIGQFGVGFYSAFMLADRVTVRTRSYAQDQGYEWESDGTGSFTVAPADVDRRGTSVILHLKDDVKDLAQPYRIRDVIRRYSSFVPHPIKIGSEVINDQRPIWVEPKNQVTDEQHAQFYQHLSHRTAETPLFHLHMAIDSPIQFRAVLYCPPSNFERLGFGREDHGVSLCAKRVLVQSDNRDLLPKWLRFLYGLVDSEDLPLNVSRETLQDNSVLRRIRGVLVKAVLDKIQNLSEAEDGATFRAFYEQFGNILKEGIAEDFAHRERIAKLLRFASTKADGPTEWTSLEAYVSRMTEGQKAIYYLGGPDPASVRKNPNLEIFRKRDLEVLYLTDPVDEFVMSALRTFEGKPLQSIDAADVELPEAKEGEKEPETSAGGSGFERVLSLFREALGDRVAEVKASKRLTESPCCLVNSDGNFSTQMQRILRLANQDVPEGRRIFEVNPRAKLIERLSLLAGNESNAEFIRRCGVQLWANALMIEGVLTEPEETAARIQSFLEEAAEKHSVLVL